MLFLNTIDSSPVYQILVIDLNILSVLISAHWIVLCHQPEQSRAATSQCSTTIIVTSSREREEPVRLRRHLLCKHLNIPATTALHIQTSGGTLNHISGHLNGQSLVMEPESPCMRDHNNLNDKGKRLGSQTGPPSPNF